MSAQVMQVIRTDIELRGDGKTDPYRRIFQYWSVDGELLAEVDPLVSGQESSRPVGQVN